jgi:hypothetical protein
MAFVNEIVSEEDVQKNGLDQLLTEFNQFSWQDGRPLGFIHAWTVDRERNIFYLPVQTVEVVGPSGRPEPTTKKVGILNWQGKSIRLIINRTPESSSRFKESPFKIIWELVEIDLTQVADVPVTKVLQVLKEALITYGHRGAHHQVNNTIVEFTF